MTRLVKSLDIGLWVVMFALTNPVQAASLGSLRGVVSDSGGNPLGNLLVSLVAASPAGSLPFYTFTDEQGNLTFRNIEAGTYELLVKSALYQSPVGRLVEIEEGKTLGIRLVLQDILELSGGDEENIGLKSLLRASEQRRLIFRDLPGQPAEEGNRFFRNAALRLDTNTGWGGPGDSSAGTTTSFAVKEPLRNGNDYIIAGQIRSGQNSLWRFKNFARYEVAPSHSLQLVLGYGRLTYDQPSFPLLDNPAEFADNREYLTAPGAQRVLSLELGDRWQVNEQMTFLFGVELNQVRSVANQYFASPNLEFRYMPLEHTAVRVLMTSKRNTHGDTLLLQDGESINLADAVYFSSLGDESWVGRTRYYQVALTQDLNDNAQFEIAAFSNQYLGAVVPLLAWTPESTNYALMEVGNRMQGSQGYRFSFRQQFSANVSASVTFLRAAAPGLPGSLEPLGDESFTATVSPQFFNAFETQVETTIPRSNTSITALVKAVPGGNPVVPLDPLSDTYETSNKGLNVFVRQLIPLPLSLLNWAGLDFLSAYTVEAIIDIRNLTNESLGVLRTSEGTLVLVQHPRTVRGGIAFRF